MRRLGVIMLFVVFMVSSAFASNTWQHYVGNWTDPCGWSEGRPPTGAEEVKIKKDDSVITLNTGTGDWGVGQRFRVYEESTLIIEDGARLLGAGWMRVGASNPGYVEQTGGLVRLQPGKDSAKLGIGDGEGSDGHYTISGGTITYIDSAEDPGSQLIVGARGGTGTLTIVGIKPSIQMGELIVGDSDPGAFGTIEFQVGANGVSPIGLDSAANIDPLGDDSTAVLRVSAIDEPPKADILLVDLSGDAGINGAFDAVNATPAPEGAPVVLSFNGIECYYNLTYAGGTGNDIVLEYDSFAIIPVDPGTNGLIANYAMENDANDSSGNGFNGTILGDPNFVAGHEGMAMDLDGDGDYVDCGYDPLFDIATNEITVSAWVTIRSIANQWSAIAAKGEYAWRLGNASFDPRFHFGITIWNAPDTASIDGVTAVGYDEWHHAAGVFDGSNIMVYLDGALDVSTPTTEPIGVNNKNVFIGDNPDATGRYWDGLIDELKIYDRALSASEVLYLADQ
jgi:hypothetical protein